MPMRRLVPLVVSAAALLLAACGKPVLVAPPAHPSHALLVKDVAVLDVETGTREEHRDVLIRAGKIAEIGATGTIKSPAATSEIDGTGATLLPGLVDMHVHSGSPVAAPWKIALPHPEQNAGMFLYAGVTTVLDTGGLDDDALRRRDEIAAGKLLGPRMFAVGPVVTATGAHPVPMMKSGLPWWIRGSAISKHTRQVTSADDARRVADELREYRADFLKVAVDSIPDGTAHISDELLDEVGRQAKGHGLRMIAHIGTTEDALDAARAGASLWIHGVYRERIPDEKVADIAKAGIPMVPTLVVFDRFAELASQLREPTTLEREMVEPEILESLKSRPKDEKREKAFGPYLQMLERERAHAKDNVKRLHAAGVTILAGSDSQSFVFPGASLHRELALLVESGLTPAQAIRAATIDPAKFLTKKSAPEFGRVAAGAAADLLLVEGDPTAEIANLAKIRAVIRNGRRLDRKPLVKPEPAAATGTSQVSRR